MNRFFLAIIISMLFVNNSHASDIISLDGDLYHWNFTNSFSNQTSPIKVDLTLSNQLDRTICCSGIYKLDIDVMKTTLHSTNAPVGFYIPAVGALSKVTIGEDIFTLNGSDSSSVGPILPIGDNLIKSGKIHILIEVNGPPTDFAGIWKKPPMIGKYVDLANLRENDRYYQNVLPLLDSTVLLIFAIVFLILAKSVGKKNRNYKLFSISLIAWSTFYLFLSGQIRSYDYWIGAITHYPARIFAGYGLLLLLHRATELRMPSPIITASYVLVFAFDLILGIFNYSTEQKLFYLIASFLPFLPLIKFRPSKADVVGKLVGFIGILSLLGQASDAVKLFFETRGQYIAVPYLNRFTFAPLMIISFGDAIIQFSGSFHHLRVHLFKANSYARIILHSAKKGLSHNNLNDFLKVTSKICGFNRVSLAQSQLDGSYKIVRLYGSKYPAEGKSVDLEKNHQIKASVLNGSVVFGSMNFVAEGWKTPEFVVVPVPEEKNPPYLLLLSDPKKTNLSSKEILPYLSQISSTIWTNLERTKEQVLRIQTEKKFCSLVQKLDPSLYNFITKNINKIDDPDEFISTTRGIVFFDQKSYSTMTEDFDDDTMANFAHIVGTWVTDSAAKYGARISNFAGDSFLLESFSIGVETEEAIAKRTLNLVWNLAQTMGSLNQLLLKEGFSPVTFRFGAHIGNVTAAKLDFIQKGLSNSVGDTVNVTARLQSLATAGSIYISGELAKYATDNFVTSVVPKQYVKGRMKRIDIFSLVGKVDSSLTNEEEAA